MKETHLSKVITIQEIGPTEDMEFSNIVTLHDIDPTLNMEFSNIFTLHEIKPYEAMDYLKAKTIVLQCRAPPTGPSTDDEVFLAKMYIRRREKQDVEAKELRMAIDKILKQVDSSNMRLTLQWHFPEDFCRKEILNTAPFRFSELPLEVQQIVFRYHFEDSETRFCSDTSAVLTASSCHANLLLASKSLYSAALPIFLRSRSIYMFLPDSIGPRRKVDEFSKLLDIYQKGHRTISHLKLNMGELYFGELSARFAKELKRINMENDLGLECVTFCSEDFAWSNRFTRHDLPDGGNNLVLQNLQDCEFREPASVPNCELLELMKNLEWFSELAEVVKQLSNIQVKVQFIVTSVRYFEDSRTFTHMSVLYNATTNKLEVRRFHGRKLEIMQQQVLAKTFTYVGKDGEPHETWRHARRVEWTEI